MNPQFDYFVTDNIAFILIPFLIYIFNEAFVFHPVYFPVFHSIFISHFAF